MSVTPVRLRFTPLPGWILQKPEVYCLTCLTSPCAGRDPRGFHTDTLPVPVR